MGGGLGIRWGLLPFVTAALLLSRAARAEDEEEKATKRPRVYGRLLANATADERSLYERQFNVTDARIGASAEPFDWLQTVLEVDASSHAPIKDAYGRFRDPSHRYRLYAGQFKTPFTARYEESNWELPLVDRGVVDDFLHKAGFVDHRIGLMIERKPKNKHDRLAFRAALLQGADDDMGIHTGEDAAGRVEYRLLKQLTVAVGGYWGGLTGPFHRHSLSVDSTLRMRALRVTIEATHGQGWPGAFTTGTALATYDIPLDEAGEWVLQPVAAAEGIRVPGATMAYSTRAGMNLLVGDSFKVMLQGEDALRPQETWSGKAVILGFGARF
ncbi:MAG: hypothetical protein ACJ79H_21900 [Myxococcales bacterium]